MNLNEQIDNAEQNAATTNQLVNIFDKKKDNAVVEAKPEKPIDENDKLVNNMFNQAVAHEVANNQELQDEVLDTAKTYTKAKMQVIKTNVDTEHKEALFNNSKDACESYGFNEKTTAPWAIKMMTWGHNALTFLWILLGTFTFMPVIFVMKKVNVGLKKTWLALLFALVIYAIVLVAPILMAVIK